MSDLLPIFPLPNVVLFPNVFLPLHIFEPRYREMVADAVASARMIGMVLLRPGWQSDYEGRPPVYPIGCSGVLTHVEQLAGEPARWLHRGMTSSDVLDTSFAIQLARSADLLLERTDALLLVDVANLYANATNHGFDASAWLDCVPLERVAYVHVGGGIERDGLYHDTHAHAVRGPVGLHPPGRARGLRGGRPALHVHRRRPSPLRLGRRGVGGGAVPGRPVTGYGRRRR